MRRFAPALLPAVIVVCATLLGGCSVFSFPPQTRGNKVTADQLNNLVPGTSTRADVTSLLGSPTARGSFDDNTWIYISEVTQPRIGLVPGVNDQTVVTLTFDDNGVLRGVKRLNKNDGDENVSVASRTTPSPGSESSFMQQLLGNVGRFTAGPAGGSNSSAGSSGNGVGGGLR